MNKHPHGANPEMLLVLAWLSTQDLAAQWQKDQQARPWKYPPRAQPWQEQVLRGFPDELVHQQIANAFQYLYTDPLYGPVFEALVRYRLIFVDFDRVSWAIDLQNQTEAHCALYYANEPYYSRAHQETEIVDEADAIFQAASSHAPLADRLRRLGEIWGGDVCLGARDLQAFFLWYSDHARRQLQAPFFVWELLTISLDNVDWHALAARVLGTIPTEPCICSPLQPDELLGKPAVALPDFAIRAITILSDVFNA